MNPRDTALTESKVSVNATATTETMAPPTINPEANNLVDALVDNTAQVGDIPSPLKIDTHKESAYPISAAAHARFKEAEYFAHALAYNLETTLKDKEKTTITCEDKQEYEVTRVKGIADGLFCYILKPLDKNNHDVKVLFRGTKDFASVCRDLDSGGAGLASLQKSYPAILNALIKTINSMPGKNTSVSMYGHSLGGADAQNFLANLLKSMDPDIVHTNDEPTQAFNKINRLRLCGFNAAGTSRKQVDLAKEYATKLKKARKDAIAIELNWLLAAGDAVQQTGEATVLADIDPSIATVEMVKAFNKDAAEGVWQDIYAFWQAIKAGINTAAAHTGHYFTDQNNADKLEYYTNSAHADLVSKKLLNKSQFLQYNPIRYLQGGLYYGLKGLFVDSNEPTADHKALADSGFFMVKSSHVELKEDNDMKQKNTQQPVAKPSTPVAIPQSVAAEQKDLSAENKQLTTELDNLRLQTQAERNNLSQLNSQLASENMLLEDSTKSLTQNLEHARQATTQARREQRVSELKLQQAQITFADEKKNLQQAAFELAQKNQALIEEQKQLTAANSQLNSEIASLRSQVQQTTANYNYLHEQNRALEDEKIFANQTREQLEQNLAQAREALAQARHEQAAFIIQSQQAELKLANEKKHLENDVFELRQAQQNNDLAWVPTTPYEERINRQLTILAGKANELLERGEENAYQAAINLHQQLKRKLIDFSRDPNKAQPNILQDFKTQCAADIERSKPVLHSHRSVWGQIGRVFAVIFSFGFALLKNGFMSTDSAKKVATLNNVIAPRNGM